MTTPATTVTDSPSTHPTTPPPSVTGTDAVGAPQRPRTRRTAGTLADLYRELERAQKPPAKGSPAYSRFVNRRLGRFLAAAAARRGMTPHQVTGISAGLSAAAITLIAIGGQSALAGIACSTLLLLAYAFDSADGQLARLRGAASPAGEWLDHVVDSAKIGALHLAVLISWFRQGLGSGWILLVPLGFALTASVLFFAQILTDQLRRRHPGPGPGGAGPGTVGWLRAVLVMPTDYGLLCLTFLVFGRRSAFVPAYVTLFGCTLAFCAVALPKWFVELGRLSARQP